MSRTRHHCDVLHLCRNFIVMCCNAFTRYHCDAMHLFRVHDLARIQDVDDSGTYCRCGDLFARSSNYQISNYYMLSIYNSVVLCSKLRSYVQIESFIYTSYYIYKEFTYILRLKSQYATAVYIHTSWIYDMKQLYDIYRVVVYSKLRSYNIHKFFVYTVTCTYNKTTYIVNRGAS